MKKNIIWNTIGSFTIAVTSLFYTIILTRYSTLEETGLYTIAFALACNSVTLASFGGRTYQVTDTKNEIHTFSYILCRYSTVITTILIMVFYLLFKDYSLYKSLIIFLLCIFKYLEEVSDVYYGVLQKNHQLYKVGQFQFFKSILNVLLFFLIIRFQGSLLWAVIALVGVNLFFLLFLERRNARKCEHWKTYLSMKDIKKYFLVNLMICILTFTTNYLINVPKYAIDKFLTSDIQALFGIIIMPATVMLLIGNFIMNPLLVDIAQLYNDRKYKEVRKLMYKIILLIFGIGVLALGGTYLLGIPVLNLVYGLDLSPYKTELMIVVCGSVFYAITATLSTVFVAMRKINIQVIMNLIVCLCALVFGERLVSTMGIRGGAIVYFLIVFIRFILYMAVFLFPHKEVNHVETTTSSAPVSE